MFEFDFDFFHVKFEWQAAICPFMFYCTDKCVHCLLADFVVEVCNALVGPVFPQCGQDMAQCV